MLRNKELIGPFAITLALAAAAWTGSGSRSDPFRPVL